jgi:hypothetical protein
MYMYIFMYVCIYIFLNLKFQVNVGGESSPGLALINSGNSLGKDWPHIQWLRPRGRLRLRLPSPGARVDPRAAAHSVLARQH